MNATPKPTIKSSRRGEHGKRSWLEGNLLGRLRISFSTRLATPAKHFSNSTEAMLDPPFEPSPWAPMGQVLRNCPYSGIRYRPCSRHDLRTLVAMAPSLLDAVTVKRHGRLSAVPGGDRFGQPARCALGRKLVFIYVLLLGQEIRPVGGMNSPLPRPCILIVVVRSCLPMQMMRGNVSPQ